MKKTIISIGKVLKKEEQKQINGGGSKSGKCIDEHYYCLDGSVIWVGPCHWPHIVPCF